MARKILLIEDEPQLIDIYTSVLKKAGFSVGTLKYGEDAKKRLAAMREGAAKPDMMLIDLILPDMNGIEVLEEAKKYSQTSDIPCFISTNYSDGNLERRCLELKAEKFILKTNYTPGELAELIKKRLDG
ncbi:MAG: response regulator [Candidatus Pacebacteria bacterium]|nr:response regulator [Candidatus Paceibacterota bacterium]